MIMLEMFLRVGLREVRMLLKKDTYYSYLYRKNIYNDEKEIN